MQAHICDSCGEVIIDNKKLYVIKIDNIKIRNGCFYKDLCVECYTKLKDTFFKDQEE